MRLFIYKTLFFGFIFFILFHLTFGFLIKNIEKKIFNNFSSEKINYLKEKTRVELRKSLEKDKILKKEDAELLNQVFRKLEKEINSK